MDSCDFSLRRAVVISAEGRSGVNQNSTCETVDKTSVRLRTSPVFPCEGSQLARIRSEVLNARAREAAAFNLTLPCTSPFPSPMRFRPSYLPTLFSPYSQLSSFVFFCVFLLAISLASCDVDKIVCAHNRLVRFGNPPANPRQPTHPHSNPISTSRMASLAP